MNSPPLCVCNISFVCIQIKMYLLANDITIKQEPWYIWWGNKFELSSKWMVKVKQTHSDSIQCDVVFLTLFNSFFQVWAIVWFSISYHNHHLPGIWTPSTFKSLRTTDDMWVEKNLFHWQWNKIPVITKPSFVRIFSGYVRISKPDSE